MRKCKNRILLLNNVEFPKRGLQNAITNFIYKIQCSAKNEPGYGKKNIKYDLNYTSLPWTLVVPMKTGEHCNQISDLEPEVQVINVKFVLAATIGGRKNSFC